MRYYFLHIIIIGLLLSNLKAVSQTADNDKYATRYRLDIPEEWKKKPKIMKAITNVLPETLTRIQDFDFCTEGKARYFVKLYISHPKVKNEFTSQPIESGGKISYSHFFEYSFYAGLLLCDTNGRGLSMLRLNDAGEIYSYHKEYNVGIGYTPGQFGREVEPGPQRLHASSIESYYLDFARIQQSSEKYKNRNTAKAILSKDFLMKICESKIYEILRFLQLESSAQ